MTIKYDVGYNVLVNAEIVKIEKSRNGLFYQICFKDASYNKSVTLWVREKEIAQKVEEDEL